jgi:hypothetical protein
VLDAQINLAGIQQRQAKMHGFASFAEFALHMAGLPGRPRAYIESLRANDWVPRLHEHLEAVRHSVGDSAGNPMCWTDAIYYNRRFITQCFRVDDVAMYFPATPTLDKLRGLFGEVFGLRFDVCATVDGNKHFFPYDDAYIVSDDAHDGRVVGVLLFDMFADSAAADTSVAMSVCHHMRLGDIAYVPVFAIHGNMKQHYWLNHDDLCCLGRAMMSAIAHICRRTPPPTDSYDLMINTVVDGLFWDPNVLVRISSGPMPHAAAAALVSHRGKRTALHMLRNMLRAHHDMLLHGTAVPPRTAAELVEALDAVARQHSKMHARPGRSLINDPCDSDGLLRTYSGTALLRALSYAYMHDVYASAFQCGDSRACHSQHVCADTGASSDVTGRAHGTYVASSVSAAGLRFRRTVLEEKSYKCKRMSRLTRFLGRPPSTAAMVLLLSDA